MAIGTLLERGHHRDVLYLGDGLQPRMQIGDVSGERVGKPLVKRANKMPAI